MNIAEAKPIVRSIFKEVLDRQPDEGGLDHYSAALSTNQINAAQLKIILLHSEEYRRMSVFLTPTSQNDFIGSLVFIQEVHKGDFKQAIENVIRFKKCDASILCLAVFDQTLNINDLDELENAGAVTSFSEWEDNLPKQRNYALEWARAVGAEWIISCDADEHFTEDTIANIRFIIGDAATRGYDMIQINCHNLDETAEQSTTYFKDLVFKVLPTTRFVGHGVLPITHEGVVGLTNAIRLDKKYYYVHTRTQKEITEHHVRELFVSGGGPSLGPENPAWIELRAITDQLGIKYWQEMKKYCRDGNISDELKQYIIRHKDDNSKDGDQNVRELYKYYFVDLHPDEAVL